MGAQDVNSRQLPTITSRPAGLNQYTSSTVVITAGSKGGTLFGVNPENGKLGLWDFLISIQVDTQGDNYYLPSGSSLTASQRDCVIEHWVDWSRSNDTTGRRVHIVAINNNSADTHTYYIKAKSYTYASTGGA